MEKSNEYVGKFYGDRQIKEVVGIITKTASGKDKVSVSFEIGEPIQIPVEQLATLASEKAIDATTFRDKQMEPLVLGAIGMLLEAEVPLEWMQYFSQKLGISISTSVDKANEILWGKKFFQLTLLDVDKIIRMGDLTKGVEKNLEK